MKAAVSSVSAKPQGRFAPAASPTRRSAQFSYDDRLRGVHGTREVLLMNADDMHERGIEEGHRLVLASAAGDGISREVTGLRATPVRTAARLLCGLLPECNAVIPLAQHAQQSHVPAAKSVPVRVRRDVGDFSFGAEPLGADESRARNDEARFGRASLGARHRCSVVAGAGFEPATFGL